MIDGGLGRCADCGEQQVRADTRGRWWLIVCSVDCPSTWRLVMADAVPWTNEDRDSLSPVALRRAVLRAQSFAIENRNRIERLERRSAPAPARPCDCGFGAKIA
jgi:hypothetical protein